MEQPRLRGTIYIGVDHPDLAAQPLHRDRQIGGQGRFADTALATGNGDQTPLDFFGGHRDIDLCDALQIQQLAFHCNLDLAAFPHIQSADVKHEGNTPFGKFYGAETAAGDSVQRCLDC